MIDLSAPLGPGMLVFPGDPSPRVEWLKRAGADGFNLSSFRLGAHNGTHVDAPFHMSDDGVAVDRLDLGRLWGRAGLISIDGGAPPHEISLAEALAGGLPERRGDIPPIVVARTGWRGFGPQSASPLSPPPPSSSSSLSSAAPPFAPFSPAPPSADSSAPLSEEELWRFSWPSLELLDYLIASDLKAYMTDAPSVDPASSETFSCHRRLLRAGIPIVENLANLGNLPIQQNFTIAALPIKLLGLEAAPCRAAAWLDP